MHQNEKNTKLTSEIKTQVMVDFEKLKYETLKKKFLKFRFFFWFTWWPYFIFFYTSWCKQIDVVVGWRRIRVIFRQVSARLLFFHLEKLLFYKGIFFQCSVFFCMPSSFHPFLVYGICLRNSPNIFWVFVCRAPFAPLLPSFASVGAPARARSTLEFQPASSTQSRASVPRRFACIHGETCGCGWKLKGCLGFQNLNFHSRAFSI